MFDRKIDQRLSHHFELLIFDMDGVLVDTSGCHRRAYEDLWIQIGVTGPSYESIAGRKTNEVIASVAAELKPSASQIEQWTDFKQTQARQCLAMETIAYSDTMPSLTAIARSGIPLALATGASRPTAELLLKRLGVFDCFRVVLTAEDVRNGKPEPEIYLNILARLAVHPAKTLVIEDSLAGLHAAFASEAYVASVRTGNKVDHPRFIGAFPDVRTLTIALGIDP